jgi:hypothetical protein
MDKVAETNRRVARALKRCGWVDPTDFLVKEALVFLKKNDILPTNYKTICNCLREFHPEVPPLAPSPERKYIDLCILASVCGLAIAGSFDDRPAEEKAAEVEALVRKAARKLKQPFDAYARAVALRYDIAFEGKILDCFGFWERGNRHCIRCNDQEACYAVMKEAGMGALANPALKEFAIPEDLRESAPLNVCRVEKSANEGTLAALGDRKSLIHWIGQEFPTLTRIDYTESVNFQIAHPYRKRLVLLKVEKFTTKSYSVVFSVITDEQAALFGLAKVRGAWAHVTPDVLKLQGEIRGYLAVAMDIPAISVVLSKEEEIKQQIQRHLTENWTGVLEHRADHDVFIDSRRQKILRFSRLPTKGFRLDFSRWGREKAAEYGLRYTSSGARYEGADRTELERLLYLYLHSIKSASFGPRNAAIADSPFR